MTLQRATILSFLIAGGAIGTLRAQDTAAAHHPAIGPGMTREQVIAHLGTPLAERQEGAHMYFFYDVGCQQPPCGANDVVIFDNGTVTDAMFRSGLRTYTGTHAPATVLPSLIGTKTRPRTTTTHSTPIHAAGASDTTHRGGIIFVGPRPIGNPVSTYQTIPPAHHDTTRSRTPSAPHPHPHPHPHPSPCAPAMTASASARPRVEPRPGDPTVTPALVAEHGLTPEEFQRVAEMLGREPTFTELGIVSALWSEHCSYKHSRPLLRTLPTESPNILQGPGENAGVVRVGDGLAVAFKIESHNHPSAVEPYQGAATGVGGILRDVFTMGARPVALLDSLRFGSLDSARVRYLFAGVVRGIGDYGNCVGIPTVAGEIVFDPAYDGNPLVNAMCVGVLREDEIIRARAEGVGNPIIAVGARTGRDGINGASFASEDLTAASDAKRPRVQVGDPFTEKLLLEASLELIRSGHIVAIQDMGAAGLTSSSAEMAARGDVGVTIDVARVPVREAGMTPYEILLSESQERMLVVARRGREDAVRAILEKWDLTAAVIGEVIAEPVYRVTEGDRVVAEFPGSRLVTECPTYTPAAEEDADIRSRREMDVAAIAERPEERDPLWTLERLLASPTIASKAWVCRQYDTTVRTSTVVGPGAGDAAVVRLRGSTRALALKTDGNGRYTFLDPRVGGRIAVAEAARNVACTGGRPLAITNCLNFGNPTRPQVYYQLREAVAGIGEACRALGTPVTGGNVSLYNESPAGAIYPTPIIGMVGVIDSLDHVTRSGFSADAERPIILFGEPTAEIGGSEYLARVHGIVAGHPPECDLRRERSLIDLLLACARAGLTRSAHDPSDGGLAVALAECCIGDPERPVGAEIDLSHWAALPPRAVLFGEAQGRAIISTDDVDAVLSLARGHGVSARRIGTVRPGSDTLRITLGTSGVPLTASLQRLSATYHDAIPAIMGRGTPAVVAASDESIPL